MKFCLKNISRKITLMLVGLSVSIIWCDKAAGMQKITGDPYPSSLLVKELVREFTKKEIKGNLVNPITLNTHTFKNTMFFMNLKKMKMKNYNSRCAYLDEDLLQYFKQVSKAYRSVYMGELGFILTVPIFDADMKFYEFPSSVPENVEEHYFILKHAYNDQSFDFLNHIKIASTDKIINPGPGHVIARGGPVGC